MMWQKGMRHSAATLAKISASKMGAKNHNWNGGETRDNDGRVRILRPDHPRANHHGYVLRGRVVLEEHLGRPLRNEEVVHHIDGNNTNDAIGNLQVFETTNEHTRYHNQLRKINR